MERMEGEERNYPIGSLNETIPLKGAPPHSDYQSLAGKLALRKGQGLEYLKRITDPLVYGKKYGDPEERKRRIDDINA
ncbi:hypothetical protein HYT18_02620 [Candidatus Microgenomates bacterium]|nr:hypothetical protein [Candidatus Microgenomates bacterium]